MTPRGCLYCNGLMWEQHEVSAGYHEVCQLKVSQCVPMGGHYWDKPVVGSRNNCTNCGYKGQVFKG